MRIERPAVVRYAAAVAAALAIGAGARTGAQQAGPPALGTSAGLDGLLSATLVFLASDADKDGVVTRDELKAAAGRWFTAADPPNGGSVTREQLAAALTAAMPASGLAAAFNMGGRGGQPQTAHPVTVEAMRRALPDRAPARPVRPRRVLVLARAAGFVHSSIPLAAATIEALGTKTGAWSTTVTYDAGAITPGNLAQYDAVFLASTTGAFLDDPADAGVTASRRQALLDFVRGGKGLAGVHAASDAYHQDSAPPPGGGVAALLGSFSAGGAMAPVVMAQGDRNRDGRLDRAELEAVADGWFTTLDTAKAGRLTQADFALLALMIPRPADAKSSVVPRGPDTQVGTWPDFNRMIGGYFKYHWLDPQRITVKIDDPASPLTAMFRGRPFDIRDEIYTMANASWSRGNVHVLTSIDYGQMSPADRALEEHPRADHDYGLSWIRREGRGRVFYEALGHSERTYAITPVLEHLLAGMQYALGDLKADDAPGRR